MDTSYGGWNQFSQPDHYIHFILPPFPGHSWLLPGKVYPLLCPMQNLEWQRGICRRSDNIQLLQDGPYPFHDDVNHLTCDPNFCQKCPKPTQKNFSPRRHSRHSLVRFTLYCAICKFWRVNRPMRDHCVPTIQGTYPFFPVVIDMTSVSNSPRKKKSETHRI